MDHIPEKVTVNGKWLDDIRGKLCDIMIDITNNHPNALYLNDKLFAIDDEIIKVLWPTFNPKNG